jgi:hypothetical protein
LFKVSNDSGKLTCSEITERPLRRDHLDTNDVFILELDKHVYIWIGKGADPEEKKNGLIIGKSFVKAHDKPKGTRVSRIVENAEDVHFKSFFNGFYPILKVEQGGAMGYDTSVTATQDLEKLANKKRENAARLMDKLGEYTVKVYLCDQSEEPVEIDEADYGHFFQDNIYLIDVKGSKHRYLIQWFGPKLPGDIQSEKRKFMDILTGGVLIPSEITRITVN